MGKIFLLIEDERKKKKLINNRVIIKIFAHNKRVNKL